jgi:hypothetical protein
MPTERLTMRRIRDVLRLKFGQGLSERAIAASLGLGKGSVGAYVLRARQAGLGWPLQAVLMTTVWSSFCFRRRRRCRIRIARSRIGQ